MNTKLTISIDKNVISKAKNFAQKSKRSLSSLIEEYLKLITRDKETVPNESLNIMKLRGSIKLPADFDYKTELTKAINNKYSK